MVGDKLTGRTVGAITLAVIGGLLLAGWMAAITWLVVVSIGRHT